MRAADRDLVLLAAGLALAACNQAGPGEAANNAAITEIEALPPDESVETPTDELANGAVEPTNAESAQFPERSQ